jgi:hemerythrin
MGIIIAQWRPEYETGNTLIDEQHKELFSLINDLSNSMLTGQGDKLVKQTIQRLQNYTEIHFDSEEDFMLRHQYPAYLEHKKQHEALKVRVAEFAFKSQQETSKLTVSLSHFLGHWLVDHIQNNDKKMIAFCTQRELIDSKPESNNSEVSKIAKLEIITWKPEYETGFSLIDEQHQTLFHAINALNSAMLSKQGEELLERTLAILRNYTTIHFETEESLMRHYEYPNYLDHKNKHKLLREQVDYFEQDHKEAKMGHLTITVSHFLTKWLIHHLEESDKDMITFLRQKRLQEDQKRSIH